MVPGACPNENTGAVVELLVLLLVVEVVVVPNDSVGAVEDLGLPKVSSGWADVEPGANAVAGLAVGRLNLG